MVGVSLPIWGKANNAIGIAAALEKDAVSAQILNQERGLIGNGMSWIAKLEDSQKRIQRFETKLIPLVRQVQEITESSYQSGNASALDLIDSDRALLQQETEYWRAAADAWIARWKLATLSGGLWLN
jgi:outer membrane protein TolC